MATLADLEVTTFEPGDVDVDFVFMALPHSQSAQYADALSTPVVDLGADFRLHDPSAWRRYYGTGHAGRGPTVCRSCPDGARRSQPRRPWPTRVLRHRDHPGRSPWSMPG